ncbi:ImmA/IrrE family metallo-endopeptidase [Alkalibacterium sp. m-11]|uniref:ImmA/IrrE family metallo-endopeptidase n=1 Tax=Alkalibacterium indicireducens TaxID=398758 RepID=A0ABP3KV60_9LACT
MVATYKVDKKVLAWAIESSSNDIVSLQNKFPKIEIWLSESSEISIGNIQKLSKMLNIPFGYFFLNDIPQEEVSIANYRTIDNERYHELSRDLLETIYEMERKQEFVRLSRVKDGFDPLPIVGRFNKNTDFMTIASDIREVLGLSIDWNQKVDRPYNVLTDYLNKVGILVFKNGIVKSNTHRNLNLEEFRAFVLIDEYAPLIFINAKDSQTAQLFSLCHELAHIWLGVPELLNTFNQDFNEQIENKELERLCNQVAAEILLPKIQIKKLFNKDYTIDTIQTVAHCLGISPQVVAIKLRQEESLSSEQFELVYKEVVKYANENLNHKKKNGDRGGNFYITALSRLDHSFVNLVNKKTSTGELLYTDAFDMLNISTGDTFDNLINKIGVKHG